MGFLEDLWQGAKRVFSKSCPRCQTNDADLPSERRIIRTLINQHPHDHIHFHKRHDGTMEPQIQRTWDKHIAFRCQNCGHHWEEDSRDIFPG